MQKIVELITKQSQCGRPAFSIEIFPPKGELTVEESKSIASNMASSNPDFISVTCSAGGSGNGNNGRTISVAKQIQDKTSIPAIAHMTCVSATRQSVEAAIKELKEAGISNVLALRGDLVEGQAPGDFTYAYELISLLKDAGFCVGAAAYPEGHITCLDEKENLEHLKIKQDAGADFFITQLCFDNDIFLRFRDAAAGAGIAVPITYGIMPFLGRSQIEKMVFLCGSSLPSPIIKLLAKYEGDDMSLRAAGIEYACKQLLELGRAEVDGLHLYSMNKPDIALAAASALAQAGLR